ncbi:Wzz/FepE/Etk N-terminal domain-containing protein [soil metagenome]
MTPDTQGTLERRSDAGSEISLIRLINIVLAHRTLVVGCSLVLFVLVVAITLVLPRTYTVASSFTPQSERLASNLAGIAAQFGVPLPAADAGASPDFYIELLESRRILGETIKTRYTFPTDTGEVSGTLVDIFEIEAESEGERHEMALRRLRGMISAELDRPSGVVTFEVETLNPHLSARVAERLLDLLNRFNLETRQSQASAERRFTESRLAEAREELLEVENRLQSFLEVNRDLGNSPLLRFRQERLEREVSVRQAVVSALSQGYEQARIDEVRDIPVITIVEAPEAPALPDSRMLLLRGVLALVAGALLGSLLAFFLAFVRASRTDTADELDEFRQLKRATASDIRRPWRLLGFGRG